VAIGVLYVEVREVSGCFLNLINMASEAKGDNYRAHASSSSNLNCLICITSAIALHLESAAVLRQTATCPLRATLKDDKTWTNGRA
jgi:hypothetical protein